MFKRLYPRTLFSRSSSQSPFSIFIAKCFTSSPTHPDSAHPDPANELVSVWWDIDNCTLPAEINASKVSQHITAAVESIGIRPRVPIPINAYGDLFGLKTHVQGLSSSGINLIQISPDGKSGADEYLQTGINYWTEQNPAPAHIFLVSGDRDFAQMLHRLRLDNYNILLACRESSRKHVPSSLKSAASVMWDWDSLLNDENLIGRYFNQPPDSSWYRHYEEPLDDPFSLIERHAFTLDDQKDEEVPEAFLHNAFWRDVQTFLNTDLGLLLIEDSISRENLAFNLYNFGPSKPFKCVSKSNIFRMIECLISEKRWLLESRELSRPFKLRQRVTTSVDSHSITK